MGIGPVGDPAGTSHIRLCRYPGKLTLSVIQSSLFSRIEHLLQWSVVYCRVREAGLISSYNKPKLGREYTGEPPVSDHPKSKDLVVAYGRRSFTRVEPQGASNKKRFGLIYFMEDNLLHAISKIRHV